MIAPLGRHDSIEAARAAAKDVVPKEETRKARSLDYQRLAVPRAVEETPGESANYFYRISPDILNAEDAVLRKLRERLRAAARRRRRRAEDVTVAAAYQGITLTNTDWKKIEEILQEAEELEHDAGELTAELKRRRLSADS